jgi:hypothetical protein
MPVKRRVEKRRLTEAAEARFETGRDFFRALTDIGVEVDAYGLPDADDTKLAWQRLGHLFLADRKPDPYRGPWALKIFGDPACR